MMNEFFRQFAARTADAVGSPWAFFIAVATVFLWGITGPFFGFSDTWQLTINTTASIVPSLMVFLIQHTQNRDTQAIHLKLDELIRTVEGARAGLISVENLTDDELSRLQTEFQRLAAESKSRRAADAMSE